MAGTAGENQVGGGQIFPTSRHRAERRRGWRAGWLTLASVDLSTDLRALLNRRIEDASVVISDSRIQMPLPFSLPEDSASTQTESASQGAGVEVVSVRAKSHCATFESSAGAAK